ncbi:hypothetical protein ACFL6I_19175, partial [candidate division KSB1 bacterium]
METAPVSSDGDEKVASKNQQSKSRSVPKQRIDFFNKRADELQKTLGDFLASNEKQSVDILTESRSNFGRVLTEIDLMRNGTKELLDFIKKHLYPAHKFSDTPKQSADTQSDNVTTAKLLSDLVICRIATEDLATRSQNSILSHVNSLSQFGGHLFKISKLLLEVLERINVHAEMRKTHVVQVRKAIKALQWETKDYSDEKGSDPTKKSNTDSTKSSTNKRSPWSKQLSLSPSTYVIPGTPGSMKNAGEEAWIVQEDSEGYEELRKTLKAKNNQIIIAVKKKKCVEIRKIKRGALNEITEDKKGHETRWAEEFAKIFDIENAPIRRVKEGVRSGLDDEELFEVEHKKYKDDEAYENLRSFLGMSEKMNGYKIIIATKRKNSHRPSTLNICFSAIPEKDTEYVKEDDEWG